MSSTPIELKLENGNVIKAENAEEALKVAAKMIEDNSKAYRETKASLDTLQEQYQSVQQQVESLKPKPVPTNGFDKDKYYQLLHDDPIKAQNYMDAARFGIQDPEQVPGYFTGIAEKVSMLDGNTLAANFVNLHQDFPSDKDSASALADRVKELNKIGHPADLHTMEMAYSQLLNEGKIKPLEKEEEPDQLPPSPKGAGSVISEAEIKKAENMGTKELEALLRSKGML